MDKNEYLRKLIIESENEIKNSFEKVKTKKLSSKIEFFDIEIFVNPYNTISVVLFSMKDDYNEAFDNNSEVFSGSLTLIKKIDIKHLNIKYIDDNIDKEIYSIIFNTIKEIIARISEEIKVPIFLKFHDSAKKLNIKSNKWSNM